MDATTAAPALNPAISGTYKVIHRTEAPLGTTPRRVRPVCGQSTRSAYLTVITEEQAITYAQGPFETRPCAKCH